MFDVFFSRKGFVSVTRKSRVFRDEVGRFNIELTKTCDPGRHKRVTMEVEGQETSGQETAQTTLLGSEPGSLQVH